MIIARAGSRNASLALAYLVGSALLLAGTAEAAQDKAEVSRSELQQKLEAAQKRLDVAAREVADLSMSLSDDVVPPHVMHFRGPNPQRAVLGMNIGTVRNDRREDGVEVLSVSPGGGAAEAGLKAGDVVTELNGKSLKQSDEGSPRRQLLEAMREVEPGEKVTVRYLRDGKTATATIVAREPAPRTFDFRLPEPGRMAALPRFAFMRADGVFGAAELVALTPKLGQYFGSEKGLLVVRAPIDARLKLEEGDVIVDIDGRVPSSPSHALQILSSYQAGEKLKLNVLRMKKRITFDITIPDDVETGGLERSRFHSGDVLVPAPAMMPLPPTPPVGAAPVIRGSFAVTPADEPI